MILVRRQVALPALGGSLVLVALASLSLGSLPMSVAQIGSLVLAKLGIASSVTTTSSQEAVFFGIRLPRVALGMLVGAGLGLAGATLQGLFRNPLVDPGLLGISSGAALFAVGTIVLGARLAHGLGPEVTPLVLPLAAFAGALLAMTVVQRLARLEGRTSVAALLLTGIAVNGFAGALTGMLVFLADDAQLRTITFWSLGSLGGASWRSVGVLAALMAVPMLVLGLRSGRALDALLLGEAEAGHLGVDVERTKRAAIVLVTLLVGGAVALTGVIGFVGLVVPHALRLVMGPDHRGLLPGSALLGAALLLAADGLARTVVSPQELPLGVVTALMGTPLFVALLVRERRRLA
ncbi:MAG: Fe3+-siderophore transporter permease [Labilithrix sp.]|nr:Fe3+-siderophore transporter permease [Labilithrix sp.]